MYIYNLINTFIDMNSPLELDIVVIDTVSAFYIWKCIKFIELY